MQPTRVLIAFALFASSLRLVTVDARAQFEQQGLKLVGTNAFGAAQQGCSVALSGDGNTAIVGGPLDYGWTGAVWVYKRTGLVWTQQGEKLVGTGGEGWMKRQGTSVSLSADGNTAIIGGYYDNNNAGAAWVFTRSGDVWTQQGNKLVGTGAAGTAGQGFSSALSADGNTAIVGGYYDNSSAGAAWVFARSGSVWTQQGNKLVGAGAIGSAGQGVSVALSADGTTAIVGGYLDNGNKGAAWVFNQTGGLWSQQGGKLVGTGAIGNARQGISVSLSADGNTAVIGGANDNGNNGALWVFTRISGVWTQQGGKLVGSGAAGIARQGVSVSIAADGNTLMAGGHLESSNTGAAWIFTRSADVWSQFGQKICGTGGIGPCEQGTSVALSGDASTAIVGGQYDNANAGAGWVFVDIRAVPVQISSFTGRITTEGHVRLDWRTISEVNNYGFNAEKRLTGQHNWGTIDGSFIPGHGTTNIPQSYTFTDNTPPVSTTEYRLEQVDLDGTVHYSEPIYVRSPTTVRETAPKQFVLMQNYPNPFNPETTIKFAVGQVGQTTLELYDVLGQRIATLFTGIVEAGSYVSVRVHGATLPSGVYVYRLQSGNNSAMKRMMLLK